MTVSSGSRDVGDVPETHLDDAVPTDIESDRPRALRGLSLYLWALLAVGTMIGAWSIATPLMAAPDEPGHAAQAAAIVRGDFDVPEQPSRVGPLAEVRVPEWMASAAFLDTCFAFKPSVSAGCSPHLSNGTNIVNEYTEFSNYPPLYYLVVGLPSLVATGAQALYAMRMTGTLMNASLIALGLFLLTRYHPRRRTLAGAMVALSPMVLFVSAVLNSSGLEIAAAFAAWCGGLCVIEAKRVPPALATWTSVAFVALILSRPISPVNAAVIIVVLMVLGGWRRAWDLSRDRSTRWIRYSVLAALGVAGLLLVIDGAPSLLGTPTKPELSIWNSMWLTLRLTEYRIRQCVGQFGWLDTPVPQTVFVIWSAAFLGITAAGLAVSSRCRRALPVLAVGIIVMPLVFESPKINAVGPYWQGRYWLPLVIGIPLVAASVETSRRHNHSSTGNSRGLKLFCVLGLAITLGTAQVWAFVTTIQRYEYGLGSGPGAIARWSPPGGTVLIASLFLFGLVLLFGFVGWNSFNDAQTPRLVPAHTTPGEIDQ
jgi:Predicted membrane protein (DUF2142)